MNRRKSFYAITFILAVTAFFTCLSISGDNMSKLIIRNPTVLYYIEKNMVWIISGTSLILLMIARIAVSFNIKRRKVAELFLSDSEKILRATINATDNGILVVDNNRRVLEANDLYFKMWNIPWDIYRLGNDTDNIEYIKKQIIDSDAFEDWADLMYETPETGHYITDLADGRIIDVFSTPLMDEDYMIGRVWSFRDISEHKQNEELRCKTDENMKLVRETLEYDKIKTEFFANISHELKTPLNIIIGILQLFDINLSNKSSEMRLEKLLIYNGIMRRNCLRLLRMINNLIYITEIDSGFVEMYVRNHDLVKIVKEITSAAERFIESKGVHLDTGIDEERLEMACDRDKIERVLSNLLSNAVKFTEEGGRICVSLFRKNNFAYITVKDTGIGIPDEMKESIFKKFRQVDKSFTRRCEGSGIGLSLAKSLVEMHKGSIDVISEYGKGSEFIVKLPIWLSDSDEMAAASEQAESECIDRINIEFSDIY